jgi:hypothetical protein
MKKTVSVEIDLCDVCGCDNAWRTCFGCKRIFCTACEDKGEIKRLTSNVYGGSSYFVCLDCQDHPEKMNVTERGLYDSLKAVERLVRERQSFQTDFDARSKKAEQEFQAARAKVKNDKI